MELPTANLPLLIRITSVPDGEAPEEVRKEWVGVELPVTYPSTPPRMFGVATLEDVPTREVYSTPILIALAILQAEGKEEAARWFIENCPPQLIQFGMFSFGTDEAELVER